MVEARGKSRVQRHLRPIGRSKTEKALDVGFCIRSRLQRLNFSRTGTQDGARGLAGLGRAWFGLSPPASKAQPWLG